MIDIRACSPDDLAAWDDAVNLGFLSPERRGHPEYLRDRLRVDPTRCWGAFEGDRAVGTLRSFDRRLTVPGGEVSACAISAVTVQPSHRRNGLLRRMLTAELGAARERGSALSILIAAAWPIYGRFGYGPATESVDYELDATKAEVGSDVADAVAAAGRPRVVDGKEFRRSAPRVYERMRRRTVGAIDRPDMLWDSYSGLLRAPGEPESDSRVFVVLDGDETTRGYLAMRVGETTWPRNQATTTVNVLEVLGDDPLAEARLWRYCWEHDWVTRIRANRRPVDEPLPWLLRDARVMAQTCRTDFMWLALLDVPAALAARSYGEADRLVLEVTPPRGSRGGHDTAGVYELEGGPDGARCHASAANPDVTLPLDLLGSLYLGGGSAVGLGRAGLLGERRPGALRRFDAMLRAEEAVWCNTSF